MGNIIQNAETPDMNYCTIAERRKDILSTEASALKAIYMAI